MNRQPPSRSPQPTNSLKPALATAALALALVLLQLANTSQAQGAAPTFNGPSTAQTAQVSTFTGRGYAPGTAVSIAVVQPGGLETHTSQLVAGDGTVSFTLRPVSPGVHAVKVLNSGGVVLSKTVVNVL